MISPEFTRAVKIKTFTLDKPIGIQLAVTGSKSIINYGTNTTIKINGNKSKEYFDVVNIDYYDAILGTPFLKKYEVIIDFIQDCLKIKDNIICNQASDIKSSGNSSQHHTSVKALTPEKPPASQKDSHWLSTGPSANSRGIDGEPVIKIENLKTAERPSQASLGLKKPTSEYTLEDIPCLCEEIIDLFSDLLGALPLELPPLRELLHEIPLIDESKQLKHRLPKCPEAFCPELAQKIERYTTIRWWIPAADKQAMPMLCIPKKNSTLHTVFDLHQQNNNTWKDITPFPEQDTICHDVARAQFRSKLDMTEAYEQTCIKPEDMHKTTFSTIFGTFQSHVIQMGDCNAPSTFQWLMTAIFQDFIGKFVHIYLDDIFIFSNSLKEHLEHIIMVLQRLREAHFFLSKSKVDLFSNNIDCLGHVIDDKGIHAESDKMQCIQEWRTPQNYNEVQKFLGLVQYLAQFMPDVTAYTTLLSGLAHNNWAFQWTPLLDKCFESIKAMASRMPILKPVNFSSDEPVWVITDSSKTGVGAVYGQGKDWEHCRPAGFLSKKFTNVQHNYCMHEHDTIVVLEALMKWEDKLLEQKFALVTDHKGLEYFKTQPILSPRQMWWWM